jgi:hypothetical protein
MQSGTSTSRNSKILVETSVLVAASIMAEHRDPGVIIQDKFYDASQRLFSLVRKNIVDRLGITTQTVEAEAFQVLQSAVEEHVQQRARDFRDKSKLFEFGSMASNICETRIRRLRNYLLREAIIEEEVEVNIFTVDGMYQALERSVKSDQQIIEEAIRRVPPATTPNERESVKLQREGYEVFLKRDNIQYQRLKDRHASPNDIRILAEAMHILSQYRRERGEEFRLYMASTDSNNFVPVKDSEGESRPVTNMIETKTHVICAWPDDILKEFGEMEPEPIIGLPQEVEKEEVVGRTEERGSAFRPCPHCGRFIDSALDQCPFCSEAGSGGQAGEKNLD